MKNLKIGQVVSRATCYVCGKRRDCRVDRQGRYAIVASDDESWKPVTVCLMECSNFSGMTEVEKRE